MRSAIVSHIMPSPAIVADALTRRFGAFVAVDGLSFEVEQGEIFGFLGPNGSGKSTTIRMLCALLAPSDGRATVAGFDVAQEPEQVKARIGYMSQDFSLYDDLTVDENLEFYGGVYGLNARTLRERREEVLAMVGLTEVRDHMTGSLPAGFKQRLGISSAVLHRPRILFLDEPTSGADPASRRMFWDMIEQIGAEGVAVIVTTHIMDEAEHCHRLLMLSEGKRIALGTPAELRQAYPLALLRVQVERQMEALSLLQALPEARDVAIFGSGLHVATDAAHGDPERWRRTLAQRGFPEAVVSVIEPSIEDTFIALADRVQAEATASAAVTGRQEYEEAPAMGCEEPKAKCRFEG